MSKQVPGRKTDVCDAAWQCQLLEAGLLNASFVPPKPIRTLRNLRRYRKAQIGERQREANRLHKFLEDTGIKLDCVACARGSRRRRSRALRRSGPPAPRAAPGASHAACPSPARRALPGRSCRQRARRASRARRRRRCRYREAGGEYFTRLDPDKHVKRLVAQLERLGHTVTLHKTAA